MGKNDILGASMTAAYSETFRAAVARVLQREGGYVNHPSDKGGETNFGITKASYPKLNIKKLTREQAVEIYHRDYWQGSLKFLQDLEPDKALLLFDFGVNMSPRSLGMCIQHALNACTHRVKIDGVIGPQTISALGVVHPQIFAAAFRATVAGHYRRRAVEDPSQAAFLEGWMNRAYSA
jgi:lysozyme family protein